MIAKLLWLAALTILPASHAIPGDWAEWRGPNRNGHADATERPPVRWSESENVKWRVRVPGRGHSSPAVFGDLILLTSADEAAQTQFVVAFDKISGNRQWATPIHQGDLPKKIHAKNTHASPTAITDGSRIFAVFFNGESVYLTALDIAGGKLWQIKTGEFLSKYPFGFAASPALYGDHVIVTAESEKIGYIAAFRKSDGAERWRIPRPAGTSYSSPVVAHVAGKDQLLISGQSKVSSYDPATGKTLWQVGGSSPATCGTMVWNDDAVFASGGFPNKETIAVRADGSGKIIWKNGEKSYEQSLLHVDGHIYTLNDGGLPSAGMLKPGLKNGRSGSAVLSAHRRSLPMEKSSRPMSGASPLFSRPIPRATGKSPGTSLANPVLPPLPSSEIRSSFEPLSNVPPTARNGSIASKSPDELCIPRFDKDALKALCERSTLGRASCWSQRKTVSARK